MHTVNLLTALVEHHQVLAYFVIFLGLIIEGEIFLISTGILAHLGALDIRFVIFFVFCGIQFLFRTYCFHGGTPYY